MALIVHGPIRACRVGVGIKTMIIQLNLEAKLLLYLTYFAQLLQRLMRFVLAPELRNWQRLRRTFALSSQGNHNSITTDDSQPNRIAIVVKTRAKCSRESELSG